MQALWSAGVGVEAGLATVEDAERFAALAHRDRALRVLIEIEEQDPVEAERIADRIGLVLGASGLRLPILLHGFDATVWHFFRLAHARNWSTRVGLEDGKHLPDGTLARDNAEMVAAAAALYRGAPLR